MNKHVLARLGALASFLVLCLLALPALAQGDPPAIDANTGLAQAMQAIADFRGGHVLLGLVLVVNLLTNLTKAPGLDEKIPNHARPFISLALGIAAALIGAKVAGVDWTSAIAAGIVAGLGSVAFHEIVQGIKGTGSAAPAAALLVAAIGLGSGCAYFKKSTVSDLEHCATAAAAAEAQAILPAVVGVLEGGAADWEAQLAKLESVAGSAVLCAVQVAVNDFSFQGWPAPDAGPADPAPDAGPVAVASTAKDEPMVFGKARDSSEAPSPTAKTLSDAAKARGKAYLHRK